MQMEGPTFLNVVAARWHCLRGAIHAASVAKESGEDCHELRQPALGIVQGAKAGDD